MEYGKTDVIFNFKITSVFPYSIFQTQSHVLNEETTSMFTYSEPTQISSPQKASETC